MKELPDFDISARERDIVRIIPEVVATKDLQHIINTLEAAYLNRENHAYMSAVMIFEKYLFRAYELFYLVKDKVEDFEYDEYFFDEKIHSEIIEKAKLRFNKEQAEEYLRIASSMIKNGTNDEAAEFYKKSALEGNTDGAFNYGVTLSRGEGCAPDPLKAAFWYWYAAVNGNMKGMTNLAFCFRFGTGVCMDGMSMIYWFIQSYFYGNTESAYSVGSLLSQGQGIPNSKELGLQILVSLNNDNTEMVRQLLTILTDTLTQYIYNK